MENFIRYYDDALSAEFCDHLIDVFEKDETKHEGKTSSGKVQEIKKSWDLHYNSNDLKWTNIDSVLQNSAIVHMNLYFKELERFFSTVTSQYADTGFCIRKYEKDVGKFEEHSDVGGLDTCHRFLAAMWYLNDVEEGGETEFINQLIKIKPKKGRFVVFPANWTHLHKGCMPLSGPKYIVNTFFIYAGS